MSKEVLEKSLWVIRKLSTSLGIDLVDVNENYDNVIEDIEQQLEVYDKGFKVGDKVIFTRKAVDSNVFCESVAEGATAIVEDVNKNKYGKYPCVLKLGAPQDVTQIVTRNILIHYGLEIEEIDFSEWFTLQKEETE